MARIVRKEEAAALDSYACTALHGLLAQHSVDDVTENLDKHLVQQLVNDAWYIADLMLCERRKALGTE